MPRGVPDQGVEERAEQAIAPDRVGRPSDEDPGHVPGPGVGEELVDRAFAAQDDRLCPQPLRQIEVGRDLGARRIGLGRPSTDAAIQGACNRPAILDAARTTSAA